MKRPFFTGILFLFILSCTYHEKFPEPVTHPVSRTGKEFSAEPEMLQMHETLQSGAKTTTSAGLDDLLGYRHMYFQQDEGFDLEEFQASWQKFKNNIELNQLSQTEAYQWFQLTGFLFQLTGEARLAEEMEKIAWIGFSGKSHVFDSLVSPYIFTKNTDHIHVNFFLPTAISYEHSLGGAVRIEQETDFPESGSIRLNFSMEIKRYIEIFVRIPSWAEGTSVTVKGVKYFAQPGQYSIIAKKWKEGDVIEIEFSQANLQEYLKTKN
jgi:hypothetical protein